MFISIISVLLVLGGLIFIHELGHFLVARSLGMGVSAFSIGFGPKIYSKTVGKTEYCLSAIPLGGYCALVGGEYGDSEEHEIDAEEAAIQAKFDDNELFHLRPIWQRMLVIFGGPMANFLAAFVIYWLLAFSYGQSYLEPNIGAVIENSPASQAGLEVGDTIAHIDDMPIVTWSEMAKAINASQGKKIDINYVRNGINKTTSLVPTARIQKNIFGEDTETYVIGVRASGKTSHVDSSFFEAFFIGAENTWAMVDLTYMSVVKLFQRSVPLDQVGGPIMIAQMVGEQASAGLANVLALAALISVNLAIFNLLPVPVLDGGHIVFLTIEAIIRRPLPIKLRTILGQIGFFLLIGLMVFATYNDIVRIFSD